MKKFLAEAGTRTRDRRVPLNQLTSVPKSSTYRVSSVV